MNTRVVMMCGMTAMVLASCTLARAADPAASLTFALTSADPHYLIERV